MTGCVLRVTKMSGSDAFCGPGKYDNGSEDETDIRPGLPPCFLPVPDRENPFNPPIRCHISEPQNPLEPETCRPYGPMTGCVLRATKMSGSDAFCGPGKYDNGSEDETDIRPGLPPCFLPVPDRENPFNPPIRCHISEPQNPLEPETCRPYGPMTGCVLRAHLSTYLPSPRLVPLPTFTQDPRTSSGKNSPISPS